MLNERLKLQEDGELPDRVDETEERKSKVKVTESSLIYVRRKIEEGGYLLLMDNQREYFRIGLIEQVDGHLGFLKWNSMRKRNIADLCTNPTEYNKPEGDWLIWVFGKDYMEDMQKFASMISKDRDVSVEVRLESVDKKYY